MAKRKRKKKKKTVQRRRRSGAGRPRKLASVSLADLHAEIHRRRTELQARRDELASELAAVDEQLAQYAGAAPVRRGPGRPRKGAAAAPSAPRTRTRSGRGGNKLSLVDTLANVLKGRTMSVTDATEAVKKTGYRSKSPNFRSIVNQALLLNTDRFKNVARGQYTAK